MPEQTKTSEEEKKSEKKIEFSWTPFWAAGWMFTAGIGAFDFGQILTLVWYKQILAYLISWFFWPVFLGNHFVR